MVATDWAVVPVAGRGTRMQPITRVLPKELLPLGRKPTLHWIVEELLLNGFQHLVFVTSPGKQVIEHYLRDDLVTEQLASVAAAAGIVAPPHFYFVHQAQQRGLGDAVACARSVVEDRPFAVALGDCVLGSRRRSDVLARMTRWAKTDGFGMMIAFQPVPPETVGRYGIARPAGADPQFELLDLVEKPDPAEAPSNLAVAGRYLLPGKVFAFLESQAAGVGNEIQLTDALRRLIREGIRAGGTILNADEQRFDVGDFPSYFRAFAEFAAADQEIASPSATRARAGAQ